MPNEMFEDAYWGKISLPSIREVFYKMCQEEARRPSPNSILTVRGLLLLLKGQKMMIAMRRSCGVISATWETFWNLHRNTSNKKKKSAGDARAISFNKGKNTTLENLPFGKEHLYKLFHSVNVTPIPSPPCSLAQKGN